MSVDIIILAWLVLGLMNLGFMFLVQKKRPSALYEHVRYGYLHQVGVLTLWFVFGFLIVPFIVLNSVRKWVGRKLIKLFFVLLAWKVKRNFKK